MLGRLSSRPARHVAVTPQRSITSIVLRLVSGVRYGTIARCEEQSKTGRPATEILQPGGSAVDVAHFFRESQWHASQQITPETDGSLLVIFMAGGLEEIARWILSWGKELKALEPPELVMLIKKQLRNTLQHYENW